MRMLPLYIDKSVTKLLQLRERHRNAIDPGT